MTGHLPSEAGEENEGSLGKMAGDRAPSRPTASRMLRMRCSRAAASRSAWIASLFSTATCWTGCGSRRLPLTSLRSCFVDRLSTSSW